MRDIMTDPNLTINLGEVADACLPFDTMSLSSIARTVRRNWKKVNYAAAPYLAAMATLETIDNDYGYDSGRSIVLYFLANAGTWRGPVAKAVKKELNRRVKQSAPTCCH